MRRVVKDMALSEADFFRWLPAALDGVSWRRDGSIVVADRFSIRLEPLPERRVGGLSLPVMRVSFDLTGLSPPERLALIQRFDSAFRRGGG